MNLLSDAIRIGPLAYLGRLFNQSVLFERIDEIRGSDRSDRSGSGMESSEQAGQWREKVMATTEVRKGQRENNHHHKHRRKVNILLVFTRECLDLCAILS
jgi:hypothetical protein